MIDFARHLLESLLSGCYISTANSVRFAQIIVIALLLLLSYFIAWTFRKYAIPVALKIVERTETKWDDYLINRPVLNATSQLFPCTPSWYAMNYGFEPILHTPGNVAGLGRWDEMTGIPAFHGLYAKNANVFAAVPSLHAAYMLLTTIYAVLSHKRWYTVVLFAIICLGIWWTAVYSGHHYLIDVSLGILTTIIGVLLIEKLIFKKADKKNRQS